MQRAKEALDVAAILDVQVNVHTIRVLTLRRRSALGASALLGHGNRLRRTQQK